MPSQESAAYAPGKFDRFLGRAGVSLSELVLKHVAYQGAENIQSINERLGQGGSVLLVSDHPGTLETIYTAGLMPLLTNRKTSGIILKDAFINGEMGLVGRMAVDVIREHGVEPIAVKTPKYEKDRGTRNDYNTVPVKRCLEILREEGGLLLTFASGTRSKEMREAEPGLNLFSSSADLVVPLTTITQEKQKPTILVHEPIPGKTGVAWCANSFGRTEGRQVFTDLVMTVIAAGQPDEQKRGFYQDFLCHLDGMQTENPRILKMSEAYAAWKSGSF